jgi:hypothetical protein
MRVNLKGLGGLGQDCGTNPCGFFDLFPFPGIFTSAACNAYMICEGTGGSVTPTPQQVGGSLLSPGGATGSTGSSGSVQDAQAACAAQSGYSWNALTSSCTPNWTTYLPWIVAGGVALFVLVKVK